MKPSSFATGRESTPERRSTRAATATLQGASTARPRGLCTTTRQSPSSSRNRSTTTVRSSGTTPVASRCSVTKATSSSRVGPSSQGKSTRSSLTRRSSSPIRQPSSAGRDWSSPRQNGSFPSRPGAGVTSTWSRVIPTTVHDDAPSVKVSPTRVSYTISSSSSPTRRPGPPPSARNTP